MKKMPITNELLLERLENLIDTNKSEHSKLLEQVTRTNGRVTAIEAWKNVASGVTMVLNIIVIPILLYLLYLHLTK
jgi:hypothetical protein